MKGCNLLAHSMFGGLWGFFLVISLTSLWSHMRCTCWTVSSLLFWRWRLWGGRNTCACEISRRHNARAAPKINCKILHACVFCPPHNHHHACVYFTRPTIAITKIRDYSQSMHVHIAGQCIAFLWKSGTL